MLIYLWTKPSWCIVFSAVHLKVGAQNEIQDKFNSSNSIKVSGIFFESITFSLSFIAAALKFDAEYALTSNKIATRWKTMLHFISRYYAHILKGYYWRSKNEIRSDVLLSTLTYGYTSVNRLAKAYNHQLCADTEWRLEGLTREIAVRDGWRKIVKRISAVPTPWWWWSSI